MNGVIRKLKDRENKIVFPVTSSKCIYMDDGVTLLGDKIQEVDSSLANKAQQIDLDETNNILDIKADKTVVNSQQSQIDNLVVNSGGDSNPEVIQGRVDSLGSSFGTIKGRSDNIERLIKTGKTHFSQSWVQGTISGTGVDATSTTRIRSVGQFDFAEHDEINVVIATGYKLTFGQYNKSNGAYSLLNGTFYTGTYTLRVNHDMNYRFVMGKADDGSIIPTEYVNTIMSAYLDNYQRQRHNGSAEFTKENGYTANYNDDINMWENGWLSTDGIWSLSNFRLITKDFISEKVSKVVAKTGYIVTNALFDANGIFVKLNTTYVAELELDPNYKHKIIVKHASGDFVTININECDNIGLFGGKFLDQSANEVDNLTLLTDTLFEGKGSLGLAVLEQRHEQRVNQYIIENGLSVDGVVKTRAEIKEWLLNRNNCLYHGKLHKQGKFLVDQYNKPIEIIGIGTHHLLQYASLHSYEALKSLKYYGINCIRLTAYVKNNYFVKSNGEVAIGYINAVAEHKAEMDRIIAYCVDLGMYAIVDWHVLASDGDINQYTTSAVDFFTYFASTYANTDNVLYELLNEPFVNTIESQADHIARTTLIINTYVTDPVIILGKGSSLVSATNTWLVANGYDMFISYHFYTATEDGTGGGDPAGSYQTYYDMDIAMFCSEWGNAQPSGDGNTNDNLSTLFMNKAHELCIPQSIWKLTFQNMTSAVIKHSKSAEDGFYKYGGFLDNDLSHNGKLYFDKFSDNTWENYIERNTIV